MGVSPTARNGSNIAGGPWHEGRRMKLNGQWRLVVGRARRGCWVAQCTLNARSLHAHCTLIARYIARLEFPSKIHNLKTM